MSRNASVLAGRAARVCLVLVGLAPWLVPLLPYRDSWEGFARLPFALVCHQRPERSLTLFGAVMPVCSRCAGIFLGAAAGALVARPRVSLERARLWLGLAAFTMVLDVLAQDLGLHPLWHATRLATGAALGYVAAIALTSIVRRDVERAGDVSA